MIFNIGGTENLKGKMPDISYTGSWSGLIDDGIVDGVQNWRAKFYTSGKLTFGKVVKELDVFVVGGGGGGSHMVGGGSGWTKTQKVTVAKGSTFDIVIGAGGIGTYNGSSELYATDGGATTALGVTANGGKAGSYAEKGGNGGSGGAGTGNNLKGGTDGADGGAGPGTDGNGGKAAPGTGQHTTTREFGETSGKLYATGGGTSSHYGNGSNAAENTGNGGQGGGTVNSGPAMKAGNGGSGIAVIRNAR